MNVIHLNNVRAALYETARCHRLRFDVPVVGITGSSGKTTTKEWLTGILTRYRNAITTDGSFNTLEGVAHMLFRMNDQTEVVILELSASIMETVREKTHMSCPTIGVITTIGKAHLSGFGDLEGMKAAKRQLFDYLIAQQQTLVVNSDDPVLMEMASNYARKITYGTSASADVVGSVLSNRGTLDLQWRSRKVTPQSMHTALFRHFSISNALAAITIAQQLKTPINDINTGIAKYQPQKIRSQILQYGDTTVVLDTYNANPTSMRAALEDIRQFAPTPRAVILGDMLELGAHTDDEHEELMAFLRTQELSEIDLVGTAHQKVVIGSARCFTNVDALSEYLTMNPPSAKSALIKGSRAMTLEKVLPTLRSTLISAEEAPA